VQADPIRAPARVQDLILFHRVRNYRAGDLERRYAQLGIEEDFWETYVVPVANFRFYAELNDFLAPERRFTEFAYAFLKCDNRQGPHRVIRSASHGGRSYPGQRTNQ
jgi:hypothetical protein